MLSLSVFGGYTYSMNSGSQFIKGRYLDTNFQERLSCTLIHVWGSQVSLLSPCVTGQYFLSSLPVDILAFCRDLWFDFYFSPVDIEMQSYLGLGYYHWPDLILSYLGRFLDMFCSVEYTFFFYQLWLSICRGRTLCVCCLYIHT